MNYLTGDNDTLESIALAKTGTKDFAITIAEMNGLSSDLYTTPLNIVLEPGLLLYIPDNLVKNPMTIEIVGGTAAKLAGLFDWKQIITLVAAGAIIAIFSRRRGR